MDKIKLKLWYGLESLVLRLGSERSKWRRSYIQGKDDGLGRQRIGTDKFGNNYYQYYSYHGLPTRRIVLYKFFEHNKFHIDVHFLGWLRRNDILPPTPEALEKAYLEHDAFIERAIQWDKSEQLFIKEWQARKLELDQQFEERKQLTNETESWKPTAEKPVEESSAIEVMTNIDIIEREYLTEYDLIIQKDKEDGKDFNMLAYNDLKRAQYYFKYLRESEIKFKEEPDWREK